MTRRVLSAATLALTLSAAAERPPAPAISLPDTDGKTVTLDEYRGRLVLLAFTRGAW
ncbi:MAG TPA: redoxin domain-containing protein [Thermoanaerobaculia bacterium]|nr:redoxin domain-containing protein [Thermoanaerobaculia bacterium]